MLRQRRADHGYRQRRILEGPQQPEQVIDGRPVLAFCGNDYLGLAAHPAVVAAFKAGANRYGVGAGAAHLVNGHTRAHHRLEEALAAFTGRDRALLFSTGYMANLGVAQALLRRGDRVLQDRLNHASLIDAARISGARLQRYRHGDVDDLSRLLAQPAPQDTLVSTDGVFSMDGDIAPLAALADRSRQADAWFMVDDAHGLGVLGATGAGTLEALELDQTQVPLLMGTLGKALGTAGAFVAGSDDLIETLIQSARTYIYTTAMPAAVAEATLAALEVVHQEPERREYLHRLIRQFRTGAAELGLPLMDSTTPIQPLQVGHTLAATTLSEALLAQGLLVPAIRPPTVPPNTARLRVTLSAAHTPDQVDHLLTVLGRLYRSDS
ncbi:8-amino-7-oxononanoate synthase [Ectothiorhodospira magna]|uniref:8-amino-7-oxononanoate synthase n=1 Tax=Ectothiorhodospira magna TaxID=867345 RepID=A0A1H9BCC8_9GAMM|nr:8-amino-7-oxononanoate synthase [Ectothiorhodospira magna]SEP86371.1 8-amino-7-oxononanoate synthase [Ectothiorhodospira magna]